jgi:hypothetical protein
MSVELLRLVAWSAYLSAGATILTFITGILFFTVGHPFGTINDAASVFQMLFMVPMALALYQALRPVATIPNVLAVTAGVMGMCDAAVLQALLVFGVFEYEQTIREVLIGGGFVGIWLVLVGILALASGMLPAGLAWVGIVSGVGYMLLVVGFWLGGEGHPLFLAGSLVAVIGYSVWAIWLGRVLSLGAMPGGL